MCYIFATEKKEKKWAQQKSNVYTITHLFTNGGGLRARQEKQEGRVEHHERELNRFNVCHRWWGFVHDERSE
jgi:hypothetical protein